MKIVRNILALVLGLLIGSTVNMALVVLGPSVISPPAGVDMANPDALVNSMHLFQPRHFLFPFLAHALGTLVGSLVAFLVAGSSKAVVALIVGLFFLAGGVAVSYMLPAPVWFIAIDLVIAYIPMAMLGAWLGRRI